MCDLGLLFPSMKQFSTYYYSQCLFPSASMLCMHSSSDAHADRAPILERVVSFLRRDGICLRAAEHYRPGLASVRGGKASRPDELSASRKSQATQYNGAHAEPRQDSTIKGNGSLRLRQGHAVNCITSWAMRYTLPVTTSRQRFVNHGNTSLATLASKDDNCFLIPTTGLS